MNLMQVFLEAFRAMGMAIDKGLSLWGTPIDSARKQGEFPRSRAQPQGLRRAGA
jgi:hypothetical protein